MVEILTEQEKVLFGKVKEYFISNRGHAEDDDTVRNLTHHVFKRIYQEFIEVKTNDNYSEAAEQQLTSTPLTVKQFKKVVRKRNPNYTDEEVADLFSVFDENGDGEVDIQEYCYQMVSVCFNSDCLKEIHHDMDMLGRLVGGANQEDRLTNTMRIAKFNAELNTPVCDKEKRKSISPAPRFSDTTDIIDDAGSDQKPEVYCKIIYDKSGNITKVKL